jgi:carbonic anhydrase
MNFGKVLAENEGELRKFLVQNKEFSGKIAEKLKPYSHKNETPYPKHLVFSCCDSRVPVETVTGAEPGEFFIFRNIANQVMLHDFSCMSALQFAIEFLKVENVIVLGHTQCDGCKEALQGTKKHALNYYYTDLINIKERNSDLIEKQKTLEEKADILSRLNVLQQVINVCKTPYVQERWEKKEKGLCVSGWLYDIKTGIINDLNVGRDEWVRKMAENLELEKL